MAAAGAVRTVRGPLNDRFELVAWAETVLGHPILAVVNTPTQSFILCASSGDATTLVRQPRGFVLADRDTTIHLGAPPLSQHVKDTPPPITSNADINALTKWLSGVLGNIHKDISTTHEIALGPFFCRAASRATGRSVLESATSVVGWNGLPAYFATKYAYTQLVKLASNYMGPKPQPHSPVELNVLLLLDGAVATGHFGTAFTGTYGTLAIPYGSPALAVVEHTRSSRLLKDAWQLKEWPVPRVRPYGQALFGKLCQLELQLAAVCGRWGDVVEYVALSSVSFTHTSRPQRRALATALFSSQFLQAALPLLHAAHNAGIFEFISNTAYYV